jgi:hypothetical protein
MRHLENRLMTVKILGQRVEEQRFAPPTRTHKDVLPRFSFNQGSQLLGLVNVEASATHLDQVGSVCELDPVAASVSENVNHM